MKEYYNEVPAASQLAKYFGFEHYNLNLDAKQTQLMEEIIGSCDEPFADSSATLIYDNRETSKYKGFSGDGGG